MPLILVQALVLGVGRPGPLALLAVALGGAVFAPLVALVIGTCGPRRRAHV